MNTISKGCLSLLAVIVISACSYEAPELSADEQLDAQFADAARSHAMLRILMRKLPKGADLHNHASGGIFAEDFISWAAAKDGCLILETMTLASGPCMEPESVSVADLAQRDVDLYNDAIDAMSTRRHKLNVGDPSISGHERFFSSFRRFGYGAQGERARVLAVSLEQAAQDHNLYVELMAGAPAGRDLDELYNAEPWDEADMAGRFERMLPILEETVAYGSRETDETERAAAEINGCGTETASAACDVTVRYLMTVSRRSEPAEAFGTMARSFAMVAADPRFVGVNIAAPEDGPISLRDYSLHMRMFAFFKERYPEVPLALHAGELTLGLTPPRDLRFHIREAVEIAGARRIGHGVDIAYEDGAVELLQKMAREKVMVEINLTSNDVILGVKGAEHPLPVYMAAGVPVALSTDDSGVARGDLTTEYMRAVIEHGLSYTELRQLSRNGLTYSFLEGESLWDESGIVMRPVCAGQLAMPSPACSELLAGSAKAREQWRLEEAFAEFEAELPGILAVIPPDKF